MESSPFRPEVELAGIKALYLAGQPRAALLACQALLTRQPESAQAFAVAGMLALALGDPSSAEQYYRQAIERDPAFAEAHYNLGNVLCQLDRPREAIAALRRAIELRPTLAAAHNNLAGAHARLGEHDAADAAYGRALELSPNAAHVHRNHGTALRERGQLQPALACFRRAASLAPHWPKALQSLATTAMELGDWPLAQATCQDWLARAPGSVEALGLFSIALDELGQTAAADALLDARMLHSVALDEAPGGGSLAEFNAALSREGREDPLLSVPAASDARYHCPTLFISGDVRSEPGSAGAELSAWVAAQVESYVDALRRDAPSHPFTRGAPRAWQLKSWLALLDREGQLEPHVHYESYVSAVYYVKVPRDMRGSAQAGYFELSGGPSRFPCRRPRAPRAIQPREGLLLLFPSYFYHRTLPFQASEPRISIAFDAVPTATAGE